MKTLGVWIGLLCSLVLLGCQDAQREGSPAGSPDMPGSIVQEDPLLSDLPPLTDTGEEAEGGTSYTSYSEGQQQVAKTLKAMAKNSKVLQEDPLLQDLDSVYSEDTLMGSMSEPDTQEVDSLTRFSRDLNTRYKRENNVDMWVLAEKAEDNVPEYSIKEIREHTLSLIESLRALNHGVYTRVVLKQMGELAIITSEREGLEVLRTQLLAEIEEMRHLNDLELGALRLGLDYLEEQSKLQGISEHGRVLRNVGRSLNLQEKALKSLNIYYEGVIRYIDFVFAHWRHFWSGPKGKVLRADFLQDDYEDLTDALIRARKEMEQHFREARERLTELDHD